MKINPSPRHYDWRDPDMPILTPSFVQDGLKWYPAMVEFTPEERQAQHFFNIMNSNAPSWRDDPTYNMRISHGKRTR